jgi:hypothetical protein
MLKMTVTTVSKEFPQLGTTTWEHMFEDDSQIPWYLCGVVKQADLLAMEIERVRS